MNPSPEPSDEQQATPSNIRDALAKALDLTPDQSVCLLYPGAGWDFTSYWRQIDPDEVIMVDPAPVTLAKNVIESFDEWKKNLISQLDLPKDTVFEDLTFDSETSQIRKADPTEWESIVVANYEIESPIRPGFHCVFELHGRERRLTYIGTRIEDFSAIQGFSADSGLTTFKGFPRKIHVVYEHKSNVPFEDLVAPLNGKGCLVWGLPDNHQTFQTLGVEHLNPLGNGN